VLVDSGPLLALFNAGDRWHQPVRQWLQAHPTMRLVSTWPVLTEVCALLARRIHVCVWPSHLDVQRNDQDGL
jgi:hypothetical protein